MGVGLLDFCGQVCFTPLEALLSDLFRDPDHCRQAFSVYAFMISLGGCLGYLLPAIDWDASALAPYLGTQEECLFGLLTLIFLTCMAATLLVTEEAALGPAEPADGLSGPSRPLHCCPCRARPAFRNLGTLVPRLHQLCCRVPRTLRRLFVAELCSWMALMTFTLFYTDFVGEGLYQGVPRAEPGTEARRHYEEGEARWPGAALQGTLGRKGRARSLRPAHLQAQSACGVPRGTEQLRLQPPQSLGCSESDQGPCPNVTEDGAELTHGPEGVEDSSLGPRSARPRLPCTLCSPCRIPSPAFWDSVLEPTAGLSPRSLSPSW